MGDIGDIVPEAVADLAGRILPGSFLLIAGLHASGHVPVQFIEAFLGTDRLPDALRTLVDCSVMLASGYATGACMQPWSDALALRAGSGPISAYIAGGTVEAPRAMVDALLAGVGPVQTVGQHSRWEPAKARIRAAIWPDANARKAVYWTYFLHDQVVKREPSQTLRLAKFVALLRMNSGLAVASLGLAIVCALRLPNGASALGDVLAWLFVFGLGFLATVRARRALELAVLNRLAAQLTVP